MDFVTHALVGAGVARLMTSRRELLPQATLAGLGGSLIMDNDSWLYLIGPNYYGFYHRTITHSIPGLIGTVLLAAALVKLVALVPKWRRFGWFLTSNTPPGAAPASAPWGLLLLIAAVAAAFHWLGDVVGSFGNVEPLWPWSDHDYSLCIVNSFDWFVFMGTLCWHLGCRELNWPRRKEAWLSAGWLAAVVIYLSVRYALGSRGIW